MYPIYTCVGLGNTGVGSPNLLKPFKNLKKAKEVLCKPCTKHPNTSKNPLGCSLGLSFCSRDTLPGPFLAVLSLSLSLSLSGAWWLLLAAVCSWLLLAAGWCLAAVCWWVAGGCRWSVVGKAAGGRWLVAAWWVLVGRLVVAAGFGCCLLLASVCWLLTAAGKQGLFFSSNLLGDFALKARHIKRLLCKRNTHC